MIVNPIKNFFSSEFNQQTDQKTADKLCEELFKRCVDEEFLDSYCKATSKSLVNSKKSMYERLNNIQKSIEHNIEIEVEWIKTVGLLKTCKLDNEFGKNLKEVMQEKVKEMVSVKE